MMLLVFFRPCRHIRDTNRRNLSIIPAVIERVYHQIIGAAGDVLGNLCRDIGRCRLDKQIINLYYLLCKQLGKACKVGISFIYLLFFGGHVRLRTSSEPITHDQCLRSCQSNNTVCTLQRIGLFRPDMFPWRGSECDTSKLVYIPFLHAFLQFIISPLPNLTSVTAPPSRQ